MHKLIAVGCVIVSATLAAIYGYTVADSVYFGAMRAVALATVAVVGAALPCWAIHQWRINRRGVSILLWVILPICFGVTIAGGIGTIAGSTDFTTAQRSKTVEANKDDASELARLTEKIAASTARPVAAISADLETAKASRAFKNSAGCDPVQITMTATREACSQYRTLESELSLAKDRDSDAVKAAALRKQLAVAPAVSAANPLATALSELLNVSADRASALYALFASLALELAAIASMLMADEPKPVRTVARETRGTSVAVIERRSADRRDVAQFMLDRLPRRDGSQVEIGSVYAAFSEWCEAQALTPLDPYQFAGAFKAWCDRGSISVRRRKSGTFVQDVILSA